MGRGSGDSQYEYLGWPFGPRHLVTWEGDMCAAQSRGGWCSGGERAEGLLGSHWSFPNLEPWHQVGRIARAGSEPEGFPMGPAEPHAREGPHPIHGPAAALGQCWPSSQAHSRKLISSLPHPSATNATNPHVSTNFPTGWSASIFRDFVF